MMMQASGTHPINVEAFRSRLRAELAEIGRPPDGWLEKMGRAPMPTHDRRPFTEQGRVFRGFYETFYHVLAWYKVEKMSTFKPLGWVIDERVVATVNERLVELIHQALAEESGHQFDAWLRSYDAGPLARYTAVDYAFQTLTRGTIKTVLDFGSGIGRQAFQWCADPEVAFVSVDAIESLYLLQNRIYGSLYPDKLVEYFADPEGLRGAMAALTPGRLYHLPTWRMEWLPQASMDLIICVQVLQELDEAILRQVLGAFRRIVKPGGLLYIRDKEFWTPAHHVRVGRELLRQGWRLIFKYGGDEGTEIGGIPRLWVFTGEDHHRYFRPLARLRRAVLPSYRLSYDAWKDIGLPI